MKIVNNVTCASRTGPAPLYYRLRGAEAPQPAYLELDPERCTLYAYHTIARNGEVPASVTAGLVVRIPMPANASARGLDHLVNMRVFIDRAERVVDGFGRGFVNPGIGVYSSDARAALDEMREMVRLHFERADYLVPIVSALDYIDHIAFIVQEGSNTELEAWAETYAAMAWMTMGAIFETRYQAIDYLRSLQR